MDREAKKRGTGVYLMNRTVNMLPPRLSHELCCLSPGQERYTMSVVFKVDPQTGNVLDNETWAGKGVIKSSGKLTYDDVDAVITGKGTTNLDSSRVNDVKILNVSTSRPYRTRLSTNRYLAYCATVPSAAIQGIRRENVSSPPPLPFGRRERSC